MRIYCDHAATTPVCDEAWAAMEPFLRERFGNASEPHWAGRDARAGLTDARRRAGAAIGCRARDVVFTGGGSEADNLAVLGRLLGAPGRVVASAIEHAAVRNPLRALADAGHDVIWVEAGPDGVVDLAELERLVQPGDGCCYLVWANNVTGVVQPVEEAARICAERDVPLHLDGVQACAGLDVDLARLPGRVTLAAAAHKLHGPKGVGMLAGPGLDSLRAVLHGGGQERGFRPGTENVAGAAALAACLERSQSGGAWATTRALRDAYEDALAARVPDVEILGAGAPRLPGHSLALLAGLRGDTLVSLLDRDGIACAAGSACASGQGGPSHVLVAMGLEDGRALGALRISLGELNDASQVEPLVGAVASAAERLRGASAALHDG